MTKGLILAALILCLTGFVLGQPADVARTNALVKSVDAVIKKHKDAEMVFADVSDYETNEKEKWQKFDSENALEKHRESSETYSIAYCWRKTGKLAAVNFTFFSPSGDWTKYVFAYYRPDGSLALAKVDYRTFNGDMILEQDLYFNAAGRQIKKAQRVLDLQTHKPKKLTRDVRENAASMAKEADYYKSTSKLPFAKLLK